MRCDACGATNPADARWCNQCLASLVEGTERSAGDAPTEPSGVNDRGIEQPAVGVVAERFRRRDGRVEWACPSCGEYSGIDDTVCVVCATPLVALFDEPEQAEQEVPASTALWLTALLPGAGHIARGQYGSGIARALLFALWAGGGVVMIGGPGPARTFVAAPLLLGALVLWLTGLVDVVGLAGGNRQLMDGRALLWLVVAVTGFTLLGAFGAAGTMGALT